jgi:hypothetical protein
MSHSCMKHRFAPLTFLLSIRRILQLPIYPNRTPCTCGHHEHDIYGDHAFAANEVAKNEQITSLLWILPALYLLFLHKPATFIPTHPWQSNHCSTSAQTKQHNHLTFHSLPTPQHATIAHTPPLGPT